MITYTYNVRYNLLPIKTTRNYYNQCEAFLFIIITKNNIFLSFSIHAIFIITYRVYYIICI